MLLGFGVWHIKNTCSRTNDKGRVISDNATSNIETVLGWGVARNDIYIDRVS